MPSRSDSRAELDSLISRLVDRPGSASLATGGEGSSRRGSRPNSVLSASQLSGDNTDVLSPTSRPATQVTSAATQTVATGPIPEATESAPETKQETLTYSKAVQTDEWQQPRRESIDGSVASGDDDFQETTRANKRLSRRERERDEEIREKLRKEIEEEIQAAKQLSDPTAAQSSQLRYPLRTLTDDELNAVTSSGDFLDFVERSSKVIERALDEEYDVLADYELGGINGEDEEEEEYGKKRRGIKEVAQFWDERWSKKRMISDISFSPKVNIFIWLSFIWKQLTRLFL